MSAPLVRGEAIRIKPEWQDVGDGLLNWIVCVDEVDGRVGICVPAHATDWFQPWQMVSAFMVERIEARS